ncbi:DUF1758 domain-containing protein [Trichonephila inaurata madagascariensis]|uniref:DUF1758 domain-containing protein n=1 Tax=Trichonephila inaurata madagascariensis TaxID=2747483 RepID=A0A8X6XY75_9ARAC|nr:DUF1758 domain-containing protein [Trichonephila inaurata madagascariensis]
MSEVPIKNKDKNMLCTSFIYPYFEIGKYSSTNPPNVNNPSITSCSGFDSNSQVLLCTALVNVCDSFGGTRLCRVLDPGSQACLITSSLERHGLPRKRAHVRISCLGASDTRTNGFDSNSQVLLCTSLVNVCDSFGGTRLCRVLDPGSQACLITSSCLERLGLPRKRAHVRISCLGASDNLRNTISSSKFTPHLTSNISFSGPIDILIGVNIALPMLKGQSLSLGDSTPFAVRSDLGWIITGNVPSEEMFSSIAVNSIQVVTEDLVSNFWKLDSVPEASILTSEERSCEDHFIETRVRNEDGRYVVRLPFHSPPSKLGDRENRLFVDSKN